MRRSKDTRRAYLNKIESASQSGRDRTNMPCSNLAHGIAACSAADKSILQAEDSLNIAIVTAYNDMLSAHQPYERYPGLIRDAATKAGAVAQVAGGVPAMCDGITQGQDGMDLSLFSRDVIALSTALALSHDMFDAVVCLGICDKIVPGMLIGALSFGHLPVIFVPAGPMPSGLPNKEKAQVREAFAAGNADRKDLIAAESASYHSPGTCTFYGTANSNQMLMEFMGLQLPGGSFVNPNTPLRDALTEAAVSQVLSTTKTGNNYLPLGHVISEKTIVNGIVGLLATGGSTNHTLHLVAMARAAGVQIDWTDFADLSRAVPLLAQVYPNGMADINHFHDAGGIGFMIGELLSAGLLHEDVQTILGSGLSRFTEAPELIGSTAHWNKVPEKSGDRSIIREYTSPFQNEGGMRLIEGSVGRAIVKVSSVENKHRSVTAPARVFSSQEDFTGAFEAGDLKADMVVVLPYQGPQANGMPELHKLTPYLGVLQNQGYKVALMTDGRMSGASGKILAAIQVTPEAADDGLIGRIQDGDMITIDAEAGVLSVDIDLQARPPRVRDLSANEQGMGRELFAVFRNQVGAAETGASIF
ncbi:MAG: phosphogluconate dehydratase [Flavobacteriaceae bacterium]|jgi:phosphogluconate dehydratase